MAKHIVEVYRKIKSPFDDIINEEDEEENISTDAEILKSLITNGGNDKKKKDKKKKKKKKKKKNKLTEKLKDFDIFEEEKEKVKKKSKDDDDFYEARFNGSLILLANLMTETNEATIRGKDYLEKLESGKVRTSPMAITNQMSNINSLLSTKLSIIKEINAVNKQISELELKKSAAVEKSGKNKEAEEQNSKFVIDKMFDRLMDNDIPVPKSDRAKSKKDKKKDISKDIDKRIKELEDEGEIEFSDTERAFKYENENVTVAIKKCKSNGHWCFAAYTEDGDEIEDYPVLDKKNVGKVKFDDDKLIATDKLGNTYDVILVDSLVSHGLDDIYGGFDDYDE